MDTPFIELTPTDRQILNSYALMLDGLGAYLGEGYELVLHSLESLDHSVITPEGRKALPLRIWP